MAQNRTSYRNILTRGLSAMALFAICGFGVVGTSAVLLGASSTAALAHGGGGHAAAEVMAVAAVPWWRFPSWRLWFRLLGPGI